MSDFSANDTPETATYLGVLLPFGYQTNIPKSSMNFIVNDSTGYGTADPVDYFKFTVPEGVTKISLAIDVQGLGSNDQANYLAYLLSGTQVSPGSGIGYNVGLEATGEYAQLWQEQGFTFTPMGVQTEWQVSAGDYIIAVNVNATAGQDWVQRPYTLQVDLKEYLTNQPSSTNIVRGTNGNDRLVGTNNDDVIQGGRGNDRIAGGRGTDLLDLSDGIRGIRIELSSHDKNYATFNGRSAGLGVDKYRDMEGVIGTQYRDRIIGSSKNDILSGMGGNDDLRGGRGNDVFVFEANGGRDRIRDFGDRSGNQDRLDLSFFNFNVTAETFGAWKAEHVRQVGKHTLVTIDDTTQVTLDKFKASKLGYDEFIF